MSALDFLSTDLADEGLPARSPIARETLAAGARVERREGWELAVGYADHGAELRAIASAVALIDCSQLGALELQAGERELDELPAPPRPGGIAIRADGAWWCRVTPTRALVLSEPSATPALRARLDAEPGRHVLDVTGAFSKLALAGPLARDTLARFCALDLRAHVVAVGGFRPGSLARTPGAVLREADERYLLIFGAAYAGYVWSVVADAVEQLGGRVAGLEALAEAAPLSTAARDRSSADGMVTRREEPHDA
jgi:heterotetrameric sarcosine oxidase gamma subunit